MIQRLYSGLRKRVWWLNPVLAAAAYLANLLLGQVFCQPVAWAAAVLAASVGAFLGWPWLRRAARAVQYAALWLHGVGLVVCAYCVWFLGWKTYAATLPLFFLLVPLLAWIPVLFAAQMLLRARNSSLPGARLVFLGGVLSFGPGLVWGEGQYRQVETAVQPLANTPPPYRPAALAAVLPRSYMAERLVGIGFRYHLLAEYVYDGWRPPLHDPLVNVLVRWHGHHPIPFHSLNEQVAVYRRLFPGRPVKAACLCAFTPDGRTYRQWRPGLHDWAPPDAALHPVPR